MFGSLVTSQKLDINLDSRVLVLQVRDSRGAVLQV